MTTQAEIGYANYFEVETSAGSGVFYELAEVTNISPPNQQVDQIEVTHMRSPGRYKEYISGLTDPSDMSLELNYVVGAATDDFVLAWRASGETRASRIKHSSGDIDTFPTFVLGYQTQIPVGDKKSATLQLKVAGAIVRS